MELKGVRRKADRDSLSLNQVEGAALSYANDVTRCVRASTVSVFGCGDSKMKKGEVHLLCSTRSLPNGGFVYASLTKPNKSGPVFRAAGRHQVKTLVKLPKACSIGDCPGLFGSGNHFSLG
jgi:hypothetical protein